MTKEEIAKLMEASTPEQGIMFADREGHLYFVHNDAAKKAELKADAAQTKVWQEVSAKMGSHGGEVKPQVSFCNGLEGWLTTHSIHTAGWGSIARWYLDEC